MKERESSERVRRERERERLTCRAKRVVELRDVLRRRSNSKETLNDGRVVETKKVEKKRECVRRKKERTIIGKIRHCARSLDGLVFGGVVSESGLDALFLLFREAWDGDP